uniref:Uncharacterized protein n=1 Tax=Panagrolaimus superbus TaxID=310955 RepID=A0A914YA28_9BILA
MKTMNDEFHKEKSKEWNDSKNVNNSTLSLHIAAYENSIEDTGESNCDEKGGPRNKSEKLTWIMGTSKQFLTGSASDIQVTF